MKKNYPLFLITFLCFSLSGYGQEIFNVAGGGTFPTGWSGANNVSTNSIDRDIYYLIDAGSSSDIITTTSYDLSTNLTATFEVNITSFDSGSYNPLKVEVSLDGGNNYTQTYYTNSTTGSYVTQTINITGVSSDVVLRLSTDATSGRGIRLQDLILTGIDTSSTDTELNFASTIYSTNEGGSSINLCVDITNPSATATTAQVVITSGTTPHLSYTTQNITFPTSSSGQQCVTVAIADNTNCSDSTNYTFEIQSVSGGDSATVGAQNDTTLEVSDDDGSLGAFKTLSFEGADDFVYTGGGTVNSTPDKYFGTASYRIGSSQNLTTENVDISAFSNVTLNVAFASTGADTNEDLFLEISHDNGTSWTATGSEKLVDGYSNANINMGDTNVSNPTTVSINPWIVNIADIETQIKVRLRAIALDDSEYYYVDDIILSGDSCSTVISDTNVAFTSNSSTLTEDGLYVDVCAAIANESATNATTVDITLDGASTATNGSDYDAGGGTPAAVVFPYTLTFPAGSNSDQCFTVFISNDDTIVEPDETIILNLTNPSGGSSAILGANTTHTVTITDNDFYDSCIASATIPVNGSCVNQSFTNVGATDSGVADPNCGGYQGGDVWFNLTVPASGAVTVVTSENGGFTDSGMAIYTGSCGSLTLFNCDDDSGEGSMSMINATGLTPGSTIYVRVWEFYNNSVGTFNICAYSANEIDVERNTFASITNGNAANTGNNTIFAATEIGTATPPLKTYYIRNEGSADLDVPSITSSNAAEFAIVTNPTPLTLAPGAVVAFDIEFSPTNTGTRNSTITIINDDADENPYTFGVRGEGICAAGSITISPSSGPIGTIVTVTGTNLATATATFNAIAAVVNNISPTEMEVTVPSGASSGTLEITDSLGCPASKPFMVIDSQISSCEGNSGVVPTNLFISEVTDATFGGLSYVELYNGTGLTINTDDYSIEVIANGDPTAAAINIFDLENYSIPNGTTYVIAIGRQNPPSSSNACTSVTGGSGELTTSTNAQFTSGGINKKTDEHDLIRLVKSGTTIDEFGVYQDSDWMDSTLITGDRGFNFRRSNTATQLPDPTFTLAELSNWTVIDWIGEGTSSCNGNDYSDIGLFSYSTGTSPTINLQPLNADFACEFSASFTISGTEGYNAGDDTQNLAYQWYYNAPENTAWTEILTSNTNYTGQQSATLNIIDSYALNGYQYYCQLREDSATCYTASHAVKLEVLVSEWNGTVWSTTPTINTAVILNENYNTATNGSFSACRLIINSEKNLTITDEEYVEVYYDVTNNGTFNIENNGSLVQIDDNTTNTGNLSMQRTTSIRKLDYVYWSSPVTGFITNAVSPASPTNKIYKWHPTVTNTNGSQGNWQSASGETMSPGVGYIIRGPEAFGTTLTDYTATFNNGVPFNGTYTVPVSRGSNPTTFDPIDDNWNLLGNPYPSAISAEEFLTTNTNLKGYVNIWTHGTLPNTTNTVPYYEYFSTSYSQEDYLTYNSTGPNTGPETFDGTMAAAQGFMVNMVDGSATTDNVVFNNAMRSTALSNSGFYRTANTEKHRIWLDLVPEGESSKRILIGYIENATDQVDRMYDAITELSSINNFYSIINNQPYKIQGLQSPFNDTDAIPLGIKTTSATNYTIAIHSVDGLFETDNQTIYLKDNTLEATHNLSQQPYMFTLEEGTFNERFEIVFRQEDVLSIDDNIIDANTITITELQNGMVEFRVKNTHTIKQVAIIDLTGRTIYNLKGNNATEVYNLSKLSQAAYIAKITLSNGQVLSKKTIKQR